MRAPLLLRADGVQRRRAGDASVARAKRAMLAMHAMLPLRRRAYMRDATHGSAHAAPQMMPLCCRYLRVYYAALHVYADAHADDLSPPPLICRHSTYAAACHMLLPLLLTFHCFHDFRRVVATFIVAAVDACCHAAMMPAPSSPLIAITLLPDAFATAPLLMRHATLLSMLLRHAFSLLL